MRNQSTPITNHFVAFINLESLGESIETIEKNAEDLIAYLNLSVVEKFSHAFQPTGITLAYVLSQSHLVIHTWPELNQVHIDLVICSYRSEDEFAKSLKMAFSEENIKSVKIKSIHFE